MAMYYCGEPMKTKGKIELKTKGKIEFEPKETKM